MNISKNSGHLCSVYCPSCGKVTDKISFNLLREAGRVSAACPVCREITYLEYDGKTVSLYHHDYETEMVLRGT
ncbi:hypothetical protein AGMMS49587_00460 [Spirochaetia bacterium]|nr:hypothetical protein AGMMS49587_00460 [Spirochaetia bacterium]